MHFISTGRNERIRRWISEQIDIGSEENEETLSRKDDEELRIRREHDTRADMNWAIEELEREMTLTAYAYGKTNWRFSAQTIASSKLDIASLKRLSQLSMLSSLYGQAPTSQEKDGEDSLQSPNDGRRNARIVLNPPILPPSPNGFVTELPQPLLQRSARVPPPITTTPSMSTGPIAFVLQESASPLPSAMPFTPALDMDAFPSTPRSFSSFLNRGSNQIGEEQGPSRVQEFFLSPRIENAPQAFAAMPGSPNHNATPGELQEPEAPVQSPVTPYSISQYYGSGASDISTPSLSMFPATPASVYTGGGRSVVSLGLAPWRLLEEEEVPPVPELPHFSPSSQREEKAASLETPSPKTSSGEMNVHKDLPPSPGSPSLDSRVPDLTPDLGSSLPPASVTLPATSPGPPNSIQVSLAKKSPLVAQAVDNHNRDDPSALRVPGSRGGSSPPRLSIENLRLKEQQDSEIEHANGAMNGSKVVAVAGIDGEELSSRLSVFSSRFSFSSGNSESGVTRVYTGRKRFQFGGNRLRSGSVGTPAPSSTARTKASGTGTLHTRAKSCTASGRAGHSPSPSQSLSRNMPAQSSTGENFPPRSSSKLAGSISSPVFPSSRTSSSLGMHSRNGSRAGMLSRNGSYSTRADSRAGASTPSSMMGSGRPTTPGGNGGLSRNGSFAPIKEQDYLSEKSAPASTTTASTTPTATPHATDINQLPSFLSMFDEEPNPPSAGGSKPTKMRNLVSRFTLKRSKSSGTITPPRPPRAVPPVPQGGQIKAHSSNPSMSSAYSPVSPPSRRPNMSPITPSQRGASLTPLSMPISPSSVPLPPTPAVGYTSTALPVRKPQPTLNGNVATGKDTPRTPLSGSSSVISFFELGRSTSKRGDRRDGGPEFLLVKGVPERDRSKEDGVRKWCEGWGPVNQVVRRHPAGDLIVEFKDKEVVRQILPQEVVVPGVGSVSLEWTR